MTRICIDLDDDDVAAIRRDFEGAYNARNYIGRTMEAVRLALPPEPIEPKAGGTCRPVVEGEKAQPFTILAADDYWVTFQWKNERPAVRSRSAFDLNFEVLS